MTILHILYNILAHIEHNRNVSLANPRVWIHLRRLLLKSFNEIGWGLKDRTATQDCYVPFCNVILALHYATLWSTA